MAKYPTRPLGKKGPQVSAQGLGCMGMSAFYTSGKQDDDTSLKVLSKAADLGITFWDTSDIYGPHKNEQLLGRWFKESGRRSEIFLATKFACLFADGKMSVRGEPEYVKSSCKASLERLGVDHIDLYYQHRVDSKVPIEHTVGAMAELVKEGKVKYLGLSECSADTLRRAYAVHPIAAVQMEYSPFALEIESDQTKLLETARELGVAIVAYSPLGRGFLTGQIKSRDDFGDDDVRINMPRFSEEHFADNLALVDTLSKLASSKGCTTGQLTLAWILAQGEDFIPIPGTKRLAILEENAAATDVKLTDAEAKEVRDAITKAGGGKGERYAPAMMASTFADSPKP